MCMKIYADIVLVTEVSEGTIRFAFKDLCPYAARLIPNWYANNKDLNKLCVP
jgi:hypothetical protein